VRRGKRYGTAATWAIVLAGAVTFTHALLIVLQRFGVM
jgi:hypothetical protein